MAREDITRHRGDDVPLVLKLWKDKKAAELVDLTGCAATLSVSAEETPTTSDYVLQSTATVDPVEGTLTFPFTTADVDNVGKFFFDVQLTDANGKKKTIRKAKWTFEQDITKE